MERLRHNESEKVKDIILNYPTVYIHNWKETNDYEVYIGESGNVIQRTKQHYRKADNENNWPYQLQKNRAKLFIIGHEHFNKSLTLDIENRIMLYMMGIDKVKKIHIRRGNPHNRYYPVNEFEEIFYKIWMRQRRENPELFPAESSIRDSAIFKASPLHKMTPDQEKTKELIIQRVMNALQGNLTKQLIFIEGEAGTGKTVLNSSTFYDLITGAMDYGMENLHCYLLVNHNEQITVYKQIAQKPGLTDQFGEAVCKPMIFINNHTKEEPVDVAFVDEARLLLTQGKQSYRGKNQLQDIMERARGNVG